MHPNQKQTLDNAVNTILQNPEAGSSKTGDLLNLRVYKYKLHGTQILLGYYYHAEEQVITLVSVGSHENFYRDLKR